MRLGSGISYSNECVDLGHISYVRLVWNPRSSTSKCHPSNPRWKIHCYAIHCLSLLFLHTDIVIERLIMIYHIPFEWGYFDILWDPFFLILILWRQWYYVLILFTMRMNVVFGARPKYSKLYWTWSLDSRISVAKPQDQIQKIVISWYILKCDNFLIKPEFRSSTIGISLKMQYSIWFIMKLEIADAICNILHEPLLLKNLHITNE